MSPHFTDVRFVASIANEKHGIELSMQYCIMLNCSTILVLLRDATLGGMTFLGYSPTGKNT